MSEFVFENMPPLVLKANGAVGLYVHCDAGDAEDLREFLAEDEVEFALNPPAAAHLHRAGQLVFVFGRQHPRVVAECLELCGMEVAIDPDVVITEDLYFPPVRQLLTLGEPRRDESIHYTALGLSRNEVPALIRMATDYQLHGGPTDSRVVYAPVHAWRALVELRAEEAIAPLIELLSRADVDMDEWLGADLPEVLGRFGESALAPLTNFLADATHGEWSRVAAAKGIGQVAEQHPELRVSCVAALCAQLERCDEQSETFNGFLISPLWELRAVEAMPVIERAFAAGRVDESIVGDVEDVQIHFGLKTRREHPRKPNALTRLGDDLRAAEAAEKFDAEFDPLYPDQAIGVPFVAPPKTGRNEPCPCGSGKKFKKCCGV